MATTVSITSGQGVGMRLRLAGAMLVITSTPSLAQSLILEPGVEARFVATTNANLGINGAVPQRDLVLEVRPYAFMRSRGAGLSIDGSFGVTLSHYDRSSRSDRVLPDGRIDLKAVLVERALFIDAGVSSVRTPLEPFGPQSEFGSSNAVSTSVYRFSPYLQRNLSPTLSVLARTEVQDTHGFGDEGETGALRDSRTLRNTARLEQRPVPVGLKAEYDSEKTTYTSSEVTVLDSRKARAFATAALSSELEIGAFAGKERTVTPMERRTDPWRGGELAWRLTARTSLSAEFGRRYFGNDWVVSFRHRRPEMALALTSSKALTASPLQTSSTTLPSMLDSMLTTRYPNPDDRAEVVRNLVNTLGLPVGSLQAVELFAQQALIEQRNSASVVLSGPRNTVSLQGYFARNEALPTALLAGLDAGLSRQYGAQIDLGRRLDAEWSGNLSFARSNLYGLGSTLPTYAKLTSIKSDLIYNSSRRSAVAFGLRRNVYRSSRLADTSNETAAYAAVRFRF